MSDQRLQMILQFITAIAVIAGPIILALIQRRAALKVEEVKKDLVDANKATGAALTSITDTGKKVHILVNSQRGVVLRALAVALRVIATDHPSSGNESAAKAAEKAVREHDGLQAEADKQGMA